ncbi:Hypothetical Protein RradSPS_2954 (plasmid) [Rubrobacter radiotolerans]|uniref:Uncharacterized protein n=1 Tax=Rubrobacter radiotolerans TaxID=42256 RepID=A0A023X715_RUBRA|nr:Hypothetical Protein RradSPS_2954 [Rubrobacter radiotolerans]
MRTIDPEVTRSPVRNVPPPGSPVLQKSRQGWPVRANRSDTAGGTLPVSGLSCESLPARHRCRNRLLL